MDTHFKLMRRTIDALQLQVSDDRTKTLVRYSEAVIHANSTTNLTGAGSVAEFIEGPLFDALTVVPLLPDSGTLVDIGSGAGLPGIPIAILKDAIATTLVEPRKKRFEFLNEAVNLLKINPSVLQTQDRELKEGQFDGAVAQAVFPPKKWLARAKRLVGDGGYVYLLSSVRVDDSILPGNCRIDEQLSFSGPPRNVSRYSARIKIHKYSY